jgi:hypothetical protein
MLRGVGESSILARCIRRQSPASKIHRKICQDGTFKVARHTTGIDCGVQLISQNETFRQLSRSRVSADIGQGVETARGVSVLLPGYSPSSRC